MPDESAYVHLPTPDLLAKPETDVLVGYTRNAMYLPGHRRLGLLSYSSSPSANRLFLIDVDTGESERFDIPNGEIGSHGAASGPDECIYVLTFSCNLYRFDPTTRAWEFLCRPAPEKNLVWGSICGGNGKYYFGTYPDAVFGEVDTATGEMFVRDHVVDDAVYCDTFRELPDGLIQFRAWSDTQTSVVFDSVSREFTTMPFDEHEAWEAARYGAPSQMPVRTTLPDGDTLTGPVQGGDGSWFAMGESSRRLHRTASDGTPSEALHDPLREGDHWRLAALGEDGVCAWSMLGRYVIWRTGADGALVGKVDNRSGDANEIMFLEAAGTDCVVGAHYSQQNLFRVNPDTGEWDESEGMIARVSGEPMAAACVPGERPTVYLGVYIHALLMAFDASGPYEFGANPREIAEFWESDNQTRPSDMATDGRRVFMVSHADYGAIGGMICVHDPQTGDTVGDIPLPEQNLETVVYDPRSGDLFLGTNRWPDCGSAPAVVDTAVIVQWNIERREVTRRITPWSDADVIYVRGMVANGTLLAQHGAEYVLIDTTTGDEVRRDEAPWGHLHVLRTLPDGRVYGLGEGVLFRLSCPPDRSLRMDPLARTNARHMAIPRPGRFVLAEGTTVTRIDIDSEC